MCEWGNTVKLSLKTPADLSSTGEDKWRDWDIDACIAPIVKALQDAGIDMRASCCGHGKTLGSIVLADGRELLISPCVVAHQNARLATKLYDEILAAQSIREELDFMKSKLNEIMPEVN